MEGQSSGNSNSGVTPQFKPTSADDLLEIYEAEPSQAAAEVSNEAEKQAKIELEVPKQIAAEKIVKKLEEAEAASPNQQKSEEPQEQEFVFAAKNALGEDLKIPATAELSHEYDNGKVAKFTVDDAVQAYIERDSTVRDLNRWSSSIGQREKALQGEVSQIVHNSKVVTEQFLAGDVIGAISALARMAGKNAGQDPVELQSRALDAVTKVADVWNKLSPEQRQLFLEKQRAEEYKRAFQREAQGSQAQAQQRQLEAQVEGIAKELGVDQEQFLDAYGELLELVGAQGKFKAPEEIQPHHVKHYIRFNQNRPRIARLADEVAKGLGQNQDFVDEVSFMLANEPNMSDNDIKDVIGYVGAKNSPAVENLNRKVQASQAAGLRTQLSEVNSPKKQEDTVDEELYKEFFGNRRLSGR